MSADLDPKVIEFVQQILGATGLTLDTTTEETPDNIRLNLAGGPEPRLQPAAAACRRMFSTSDTIVAIATPPGRGGIGVVRLSGPDAGRIAQALVGRDTPFEARHATFARILEPASDARLRAV